MSEGVLYILCSNQGKDLKSILDAQVDESWWLLVYIVSGLNLKNYKSPCSILVKSRPSVPAISEQKKYRTKLQTTLSMGYMITTENVQERL